LRQVEIYRCEDCGLEVALSPPVTRQCPACNGNFVVLSEVDENGTRNLYTPSINRVVKNVFEDMFNELESYLEEQ